MPAKNRKLNQKINKKRMILFALAIALMGTVLLSQTFAFRSIGAGFGTFYAPCTFSHRSSDDPIVFPGVVGAAHSHDFFGSRTTDAFSTVDSIRQSATSCVRPGPGVKDSDHSAYWVPTLYVNNQPVAARSVSAFYKPGIRKLSTIQPFPAGLKIIAGTATGGPQHTSGQNRIYLWRCHVTATVAPGNATTAPTCRDYTEKDASLNLHIIFPDCWDGVNLDSANHKSHMAYSPMPTAQKPVSECPASHPVQVPVLELIFQYPTNGGPTSRLSSGDMTTSHADFVNGWDQAKLTALVNDCLRIDNYCGGGDKPVPGHAGNEPDPVVAPTNSGSSASPNGSSSSLSGDTGGDGGSSTGGGTGYSGGSTAGGGGGPGSSSGGAATSGSSAYPKAAKASTASKILSPVESAINKVGTSKSSIIFKVIFLIGLVCLVASLLSGDLPLTLRRLLAHSQSFNPRMFLRK